MDTNRAHLTDRIEYAHTSYSALPRLGDVDGPSTSDAEPQLPTRPVQQKAANQGELPLGKAIRMHPKLSMYIAGLMVSLFIHGYDMAVIGSISGNDGFLEDYGERGDDGELYTPSHWTALWNALPGLGSVTGTLIAGSLQDRIGRRWCLCTGGFTSLIGVTILFTSNMHPTKDAMRASLLVGMVLQGLAVGITDTQAMTYASENIPTSLRGPAMALNPTFLFLGQLIGAAVLLGTGDLPGEWSYRIALASQWPLAGLLFVFAFVLPESPAYLIRIGKYDTARHALHRLYTEKAKPDDIFQEMRSVIQEEGAHKEDVSYKECFVGVDARRTGIVAFTNLYTGTAGLGLLSSASYFLRIIGLGESDAFLLLLIGTVLAFVANASSLFILPRVGRRKLILCGFALITVFWTMVGVSGFWRSLAIAWFTGALFMIIAFTVGFLIWPAGYAVAGETSSLRLRSKSQAIGGFANNICSAVINLFLPYVYNSDAGDLGGITALIFTAFGLASLVGTWFIVPELKGRDAHEIDAMFRLRLPTRAFKNWQESAEELKPISSDSFVSK